jgi:hypothetical protein
MRARLWLDSWVWCLYHRLAWHEHRFWADEGGVSFHEAFDIVSQKLLAVFSRRGL